jgi:hypothetical protein
MIWRERRDVEETTVVAGCWFSTALRAQMCGEYVISPPQVPDVT